MNIYFRELKAHRKSLIIWSIAMILLVVWGMIEYKSYMGTDESSVELIKIMESMPQFIKSLWGMSYLDITTAIGYFGALYPYLLLMASIHASTLGSNIIAKEERDKTVEFLMTKPVSRYQIITTKVLVSLTNIIIVNLAIYVTSIMVLKGLTHDSIATPIILSMIATFFIQLLFMIIGICIASIMKKPKRSGTITMAIILSCFFASLIIDLSDKLEILSFLTPFKYFEAKIFYASGYLSIGYIVLVLIVSVALLMLSYKQYNKRDLNL
jgi:ABC-2 type transport system permease protein